MLYGWRSSRKKHCLSLNISVPRWYLCSCPVNEYGVSPYMISISLFLLLKISTLEQWYLISGMQTCGGKLWPFLPSLPLQVQRWGQLQLVLSAKISRGDGSFGCWAHLWAYFASRFDVGDLTFFLGNSLRGFDYFHNSWNIQVRCCHCSSLASS